MASTTKPISPDHIPLSTSSSLSPTHAFYIQHTHNHTTEILDLTPSLSSLFTPATPPTPTPTPTSNTGEPSPTSTSIPITPILTTNPSSSTSTSAPLPPTPNPTPTQPKLSLPTALTLLKSIPPPQALYILQKKNLFGTHISVHDVAGVEVAEWRSPILSFHVGRTSITFLHPERHGEGEGEERHVEDVVGEAVGKGKDGGKGKQGGKEGKVDGETVEVRPVGSGRRAEVFYMDNIPYIWQVEKFKHEHKMLYKVIHADSSHPTKLEIGQYLQPSPRDKDGVLVLDARELDVLPGVLTLCAMLEARVMDGDDERTGLERMADVPVLMM